MKKLKLDVEALRVHSFETLRPVRGARGTVRGHSPTRTDDITLPSGCGSCATSNCTIACTTE